MRKPFLAGNWKMNTDGHSSVELAKAVAVRLEQTAAEKATVAVCPPFVYLSAVAKALISSKAVFNSPLLFTNSALCLATISWR